MLIETLLRKQAELEETDGGFAKRLGISPSLWCRLKSGERRFTPRTLTAIKAAFPEESWDVLLFWLNELEKYKGKAARDRSEVDAKPH